eukprot:1141155-Pelagomonas_calceolata.AAC.1
MSLPVLEHPYYLALVSYPCNASYLRVIKIVIVLFNYDAAAGQAVVLLINPTNTRRSLMHLAFLKC